MRAHSVQADQLTSSTVDSPQPHDGWLSLIRHIGSELAHRNLTQIASSLTFTSILAMVPLLTVVLSIFTAFPIFQDFQLSLEEFLTSKLMPDAVSDNVMEHLNQFASKAASLTAIGSIFLFVTSVMLISTIDKAFNDIWLVKEQRPLGHRILVYWAIVTLGPLVIGASLWASGSLARTSLGYVQGVPLITSLVLTIVPMLLTAVAFAALFVYVPNCRIRWRDALLGGILTSIVLELLRTGFAFYITRFPTYTLIYGAFATVPIFLLWVYLSWLVVLSGATFVALLPKFRHRTWGQNNYAGYQFALALQLLRQLWQAREQKRLGCTAEELSITIKQELQVVETLLGALKGIGFVVNTEVGNDEVWVLACDPTQENIGPVLDLFVIDRAAVIDPLGRPLINKLNQVLQTKPDFRLSHLFQTQPTNNNDNTHTTDNSGEHNAKGE